MDLMPKRIAQIKSFIAMDILEMAQTMQAQGREIISLALGEPDFKPPAISITALKNAISDNMTKYTHSQGILELRVEICHYYKKKYGVKIDPDQIFITAGTSPAMLITFGCLVEKDDEVLLSDLHYPCYPNFLYFYDAKPVFIPTQASSGFAIDPNILKDYQTPKTKALLITSPCNPSGHVLSAKTLKAYTKSNILLLSDEIYHGLTYEGKEHSILEFTDQAIVFNGFSKSYAMTGFRLGYVIVPKGMIATLRKLQQNFYISTNAFVQMAGLAVLRKGEKAQTKMRETFNKRRLFVLDKLKKIGLKPLVRPTGAFYVLIDISKYSQDSLAFSKKLLQKTGVAVTPGIDFGKVGEGMIRISYANSIQKLDVALTRLGDFLKTTF